VFCTLAATLWRILGCREWAELFGEKKQIAGDGGARRRRSTECHSTAMGCGSAEWKTKIKLPIIVAICCSFYESSIRMRFLKKQCERAARADASVARPRCEPSETSTAAPPLDELVAHWPPSSSSWLVLSQGLDCFGRLVTGDQLVVLRILLSLAFLPRATSWWVPFLTTGVAFLVSKVFLIIMCNWGCVRPTSRYISLGGKDSRQSYKTP
jgi:hypothetical protein